MGFGWVEGYIKLSDRQHSGGAHFGKSTGWASSLKHSPLHMAQPLSQ